MEILHAAINGIPFPRIDRDIGGTHNPPIHRVERDHGQDTGQERGNLQLGMQKAGCQSRQHTAAKGQQQRHEGISAVHNPLDGDRRAGGDAALNGQIRNVQNTIGQVDAKRHHRPKKALGDGARYGC